jgi:hypothetical protein
VVPFLDGEVDDLAHDERRQVDLAAGLNLSVSRDLGEEIDLLDFRGGHPGEVAVPSRERKGEDRAEAEHHGRPDDDFDFLRHRASRITDNL